MAVKEHKTEIIRYNGSLEGLVEDLARLRNAFVGIYDAWNICSKHEPRS